MDFWPVLQNVSFRNCILNSGGGDLAAHTNTDGHLQSHYISVELHMNMHNIIYCSLKSPWEHECAQQSSW